MGMKIKGSDELRRKFQDLSQKAKDSAAAPERVKLDQLLPTEFMQRHTKFGSIDAMFKASGMQMNPLDVFSEEKIAPDWDAFVAENSSFSNWRDMLAHAVTERTKRKLGLG